MSLGAVVAHRGPSRAAVAGSTRKALVDALSMVPGLSAGSNAPDVATAGSAWPRWVQTTYAGHLCDLTADEYDVYVVLPGDYLDTTVDQGDTFRAEVEPALLTVARIQWAEPVSIQFQDQQNMPGLRFRVTTK